MNKLVSGAVGVSLQLQQGKNYLPDILDLKNRRIKHIDLCDAVNYDMDGNAVSSSLAGYLNIMEQNTQTLKVCNFSMQMLALSVNKGNRTFINKIIDMPHSYIDWNGTAGAYVYLLFWYDEPAVSNTIPAASADKVVYDAFEVVVTSSPARRYEFGENRTLFGKKFRNLLLQSYNGITPKGNTNVGSTLTHSAFVTLQKGTRAFMRGIPAYVLMQNADIWPLRMQNIEFDFTNSYIEVSPAAGVSPVAGTSFLIDCEVDDNQ